MLYGIAKNSAELYGIPCNGMLLNSAEFRNVYVSAELRTISGNFNFFVFLNFNLSKMTTIPTSTVTDPEPKSQDNFRSGPALDPDSMYDYCVQYTYA
jgi:hypothetical protein